MKMSFSRAPLLRFNATMDRGEIKQKRLQSPRDAKRSPSIPRPSRPPVRTGKTVDDESTTRSSSTGSPPRRTAHSPDCTSGSAPASPAAATPLLPAASAPAPPPLPTSPTPTSPALPISPISATSPASPEERTIVDVTAPASESPPPASSPASQRSPSPPQQVQGPAHADSVAKGGEERERDEGGRRAAAPSDKESGLSNGSSDARSPRGDGAPTRPAAGPHRERLSDYRRRSTMEMQYRDRMRRYSQAKRDLRDKKKSAAEIFFGIQEIKKKYKASTGRELTPNGNHVLTSEKERVSDSDAIPSDKDKVDAESKSRQVGNEDTDVLEICKTCSGGPGFLILKKVQGTCQMYIGLCKEIMKKRNNILELVEELVNMRRPVINQTMKRKLKECQKEAAQLDGYVETTRQRQVQNVARLGSAINTLAADHEALKKQLAAALKAKAELESKRYDNGANAERLAARAAAEERRLRAQVERVGAQLEALAGELKGERQRSHALQAQANEQQEQLQESFAYVQELEAKLKEQTDISQQMKEAVKMNQIQIHNMIKERCSILREFAEMKNTAATEVDMIVREMETRLDLVNRRLQEEIEMSERLREQNWAFRNMLEECSAHKSAVELADRGVQTASAHEARRAPSARCHAPQVLGSDEDGEEDDEVKEEENLVEAKESETEGEGEEGEGCSRSSVGCSGAGGDSSCRSTPCTSHYGSRDEESRARGRECMAGAGAVAVCPRWRGCRSEPAVCLSPVPTAPDRRPAPRADQRITTASEADTECSDGASTYYDDGSPVKRQRKRREAMEAVTVWERHPRAVATPDTESRTASAADEREGEEGEDEAGERSDRDGGTEGDGAKDDDSHSSFTVVEHSEDGDALADSEQARREDKLRSEMEATRKALQHERELAKALEEEMLKVQLEKASLEVESLKIASEKSQLQDSIKEATMRENKIKEHLENEFLNKLMVELRPKEKEIERLQIKVQELSMLAEFNKRQFSEYERRMKEVSGIEMKNSQDGVASLKGVVADLHTHVESMREALLEVRARNEQLERALAAKGVEAEAQAQQARRHSKALLARDAQLHALSVAVRLRDRHSAKIEREVRHQTEQMAQLQQLLRVRDDQLTRLTQMVEELSCARVAGCAPFAPPSAPAPQTVNEDRQKLSSPITSTSHVQLQIHAPPTSSRDQQTTPSISRSSSQMQVYPIVQPETGQVHTVSISPGTPTPQSSQFEFEVHVQSEAFADTKPQREAPVQQLLPNVKTPQEDVERRFLEVEQPTPPKRTPSHTYTNSQIEIQFAQTMQEAQASFQSKFAPQNQLTPPLISNQPSQINLIPPTQQDPQHQCSQNTPTSRMEVEPLQQTKPMTALQQEQLLLQQEVRSLLQSQIPNLYQQQYNQLDGKDQHRSKQFPQHAYPNTQAPINQQTEIQQESLPRELGVQREESSNFSYPSHTYKCAVTNTQPTDTTEAHGVAGKNNWSKGSEGPRQNYEQAAEGAAPRPCRASGAGAPHEMPQDAQWPPEIQRVISEAVTLVGVGEVFLPPSPLPPPSPPPRAAPAWLCSPRADSPAPFSAAASALQGPFTPAVAHRGFVLGPRTGSAPARASASAAVAALRQRLTAVPPAPSLLAITPRRAPATAPAAAPAAATATAPVPATQKERGFPLPGTLQRSFSDDPASNPSSKLCLQEKYTCDYQTQGSPVAPERRARAYPKECESAGAAAPQWDFSPAVVPECIPSRRAARTPPSPPPSPPPPPTRASRHSRSAFSTLRRQKSAVQGPPFGSSGFGRRSPPPLPPPFAVAPRHSRAFNYDLPFEGDYVPQHDVGQETPTTTSSEEASLPYKGQGAPPLLPPPLPPPPPPPPPPPAHRLGPTHNPFGLQARALTSQRSRSLDRARRAEAEWPAAGEPHGDDGARAAPRRPCTAPPPPAPPPSPPPSLAKYCDLASYERYMEQHVAGGPRTTWVFHAAVPAKGAWEDEDEAGRRAALAGGVSPGGAGGNGGGGDARALTAERPAGLRERSLSPAAAPDRPNNRQRLSPFRHVTELPKIVEFTEESSVDSTSGNSTSRGSVETKPAGDEPRPQHKPGSSDRNGHLGPTAHSHKDPDSSATNAPSSSSSDSLTKGMDNSANHNMLPPKKAVPYIQQVKRIMDNLELILESQMGNDHNSVISKSISSQTLPDFMNEGTRFQGNVSDAHNQRQREANGALSPACGRSCAPFDDSMEMTDSRSKYSVCKRVSNKSSSCSVLCKRKSTSRYSNASKCSVKENLIIPCVAHSCLQRSQSGSNIHRSPYTYQMMIPELHIVHTNCICKFRNNPFRR